MVPPLAATPIPCPKRFAVEKMVSKTVTRIADSMVILGFIFTGLPIIVAEQHL
jgi:hypothetical protein